MRFKIDWTSHIVNLWVFFCFTLYLRAIFQVQAPGGLYLEGRFNGGFFALPVWGAYIWRGVYMKGLIFGILQYFPSANLCKSILSSSVELATTWDQAPQWGKKVKNGVK